MFCAKVRELLSRKGAGYEERDITTDPRAMEELSALGYLTTPVTVINRDLVIVGFDQKQLEAVVG